MSREAIKQENREYFAAAFCVAPAIENMAVFLFGSGLEGGSGGVSIIRDYLSWLFKAIMNAEDYIEPAVETIVAGFSQLKKALYGTIGKRRLGKKDGSTTNMFKMITKSKIIGSIVKNTMSMVHNVRYFFIYQIYKQYCETRVDPSFNKEDCLKVGYLSSNKGNVNYDSSRGTILKNIADESANEIAKITEAKGTSQFIAKHYPHIYRTKILDSASFRYKLNCTSFAPQRRSINFNEIAAYKYLQENGLDEEELLKILGPSQNPNAQDDDGMLKRENKIFKMECDVETKKCYFKNSPCNKIKKSQICNLAMHCYWPVDQSNRDCLDLQQLDPKDKRTKGIKKFQGVICSTNCSRFNNENTGKLQNRGSCEANQMCKIVHVPEKQYSSKTTDDIFDENQGKPACMRDFMYFANNKKKAEKAKTLVTGIRIRREL